MITNLSTYSFKIYVCLCLLYDVCLFILIIYRYYCHGDIWDVADTRDKSELWPKQTNLNAETRSEEITDPWWHMRASVSGGAQWMLCMGTIALCHLTYLIIFLNMLDTKPCLLLLCPGVQWWTSMCTRFYWLLRMISKHGASIDIISYDLPGPGSAALGDGDGGKCSVRILWHLLTFMLFWSVQ